MRRSVEVYDIDGFENTAEEVKKLHEKGIHVICYIDVGGAEEYRPDYSKFKEDEEKYKVQMTGNRIEKWEEFYINIKELTYVEPIMKARFEMRKEKGFDAVEPDEDESWTVTEAESGIKGGISKADQLAYNKWIAETVHSLGMAVIQKNDAGQTSEQNKYFDGVITEECNLSSECGDFKPYLEEGKPVMNAEYSNTKAKFCKKDEEAGIMGARFNVNLNGKRFEPCW